MKNRSFSADANRRQPLPMIGTAGEWFARLRRTGSRLVMLMIVMFTPGTVLANTPDASNFTTKYNTAGTRIDANTNCQVCHTASIPALNPYGSAYKAAGRNLGAFGTIESSDSDGDGFTNLVEIKALTFPGNAADKPFTVGGTMSGLTGSVTLKNNGGNNLVRTTNGAFVFSTPLLTGSAYAVTVSSQPAGQTCTVTNGSGTIASANVTNVGVACVTNPVATFTVGGSVSGLTGSVTLQNNGGNNLVRTTNGAFVFSTALPTGSPYAVTVSSQPSGQTCTVTNGSGTIASANVTNVGVTCAATPPVIFALTVARDGTGTGTVSGSGIDCGTDCSENFANFTSVTLTATAAAGSTFAGWSGACSNSSGDCTVTMTAARSVTATFTLVIAPNAPLPPYIYTDIWLDTNEVGQGYNLVHSDIFIFITFFIYGPDGTPTWYIAGLVWDGVDSFTGALSATTGTYYGVPWVPGNFVEDEQAGTASFKPSATNAYQGTLSFSVTNGGSAVKSIERQTLTPIALNGTYAGGQTGAYTGCTNPADDGQYQVHFNLAVTQPGDGSATLVFTYNGLTCTLAGTLVPHGQLYVMPSATYTCSGGFTLDTTATVSELKSTGSGIAGRFTAPMVGDGCAESASFGAALSERP